MSILLLLLDIFLKPEAPKFSLNGRLLGYALILMAGAIGLYFLFQGLVPVVGYIESGALVSVILAAVGYLFLLFSNEKKKAQPLDKFFKKSNEHFKDRGSDLERIFKENAPTIILYSCLAGLTIYQIITLVKVKPKKD